MTEVIDPNKCEHKDTYETRDVREKTGQVRLLKVCKDCNTDWDITPEGYT